MANEPRLAPQPLDAQPSQECPAEIYGGYMHWGQVLSRTLAWWWEEGQ